MKKITKNLFVFSAIALLIAGSIGCSKSSGNNSSSSTNPTGGSTPSFSATINGSSTTLGATANYNASNALTIIATGTGSSPDVIVLNVTATATGSYTLNTTNSGVLNVGSTGIKYSTDATHTGTVNLTTLTTTGSTGSRVAAGTFNFTASQVSPSGSGTATVTSGSFYCVW